MSVDINVVSGSFEGTTYTLKQKIKDAIVLSSVEAIEAALSEWLPTVARRTGRMQSALRQMLFNQVTGITGEANFSIEFQRSMLGSPHYLKYHDINWSINPHFNASGYFNPSTPNTRPISELEIIYIIKQKILYYLGIEFSKLGLDYTTYASVS